MNPMKKMTTRLCILGGGPAGYVAALRAAQLGAEVILIEEKELGGVCLNAGCIPTKALLKSSDVATVLAHSAEFGMESRMGSIRWPVAIGRKNRVVKNLNTGLTQLLHARGVTVLSGRGTVISDKEIQVKTSEENILITCEKMILTTGAVPLLPNIEGIDLDGVITSTEALSLEVLPVQMAIIGAGVIGLEFATMYAAVGVKVTVIELKDCIIPGEDREAAAELMKIMTRQGISFKLSAYVEKIQKTDEGLAVLYSMNKKPYVQVCEKVLMAVGRKLNADMFQNLSLQLERGAVAVNDNMETNIKGVYAAGDLVGGKLLAHLAFMEGRIAAENAMGLNSRMHYEAVPTCIYTNPEIAVVGISEEGAEKAGILLKVGRFAFRHNGRALTLGEREGFVKVFMDEQHTLLGGVILGANASEMISLLTLAVTMKAKAETLADMMHPHPSLSEAIWEACADAIGRPIHKA